LVPKLEKEKFKSWDQIANQYMKVRVFAENREIILPCQKKKVIGHSKQWMLMIFDVKFKLSPI
jgi:hypothetical protein